MTQELRCPRCGADLECEAHSEAGRITFGRVRFKPVPSLIPAKTTILAERLRQLADDLERGRFEGPDGALVLLIDSDRKHLDFTNRFGLTPAWHAEAAKRAALELNGCG